MATVGQPLPTLEAGWRRYDDADSRIQYTNFKSDGDSNWYDGTAHSSVNPDSKIVFNFYGSRLRILSDMYTYYGDNKINVDGVDDTYNQYSTSSLHTILLYEKTLSLGVHTVILSPDNIYNGISLDAIDIDDTGYLMLPASTLTATAGDSQVSLSWDAVLMVRLAIM